MAQGSPFSFWQFCLLILALAAASGTALAQDSLTVRGWITASPDSMASQPLVQLTSIMHPAPPDSAWVRVTRNAPVRCWAEGHYGKAQVEATWPRFGDSLSFTVQTDSLGLNWALGPDTLFAAWSKTNKGCFPFIPSSTAQDFIQTLQDMPFESKRQLLVMSWLDDHCIRVTNLQNLLGAFDDENRRLSIIQNAVVSDPEHLGTLSGSFFTAHYRKAFDQWWNSVH